MKLKEKIENLFFIKQKYEADFKGLLKEFNITFTVKELAHIDSFVVLHLRVFRKKGLGLMQSDILKQSHYWSVLNWLPNARYTDYIMLIADSYTK